MSARIRTIFVAAALVGVACFSERSAAPSEPIGDPCDAAEAPRGVVLIRDFGFQPAQIRVREGASVRWVNCDPEAHTSTAGAGAWNSGTISPGAAYTRVFERAGSFDYHCEPHPFMRGRVVVE